MIRLRLAVAFALAAQTALLSAADKQSAVVAEPSWIWLDKPAGPAAPEKIYFRKEFAVDREVTSAKLYGIEPRPGACTVDNQELSQIRMSTMAIASASASAATNRVRWRDDQGFMLPPPAE